MKLLLNSLVGSFLTPVGVLVLGALDSSLIFFLPLGIDFVVVILSARDGEFFWGYALLATVGSLVGAGVTFWLGRKLGQHGIARFVKPSTLARVQSRVSHSAAVTVAALGIIPPPFPFTAFVLTSGACGLNAWTFFTAFAAVRLVRFMVEGALAVYYGRGILRWMQSPTFTAAVIAITALAIVGTIVSAVAVYRSTRRGVRGAKPLEQMNPSDRTTS